MPYEKQLTPKEIKANKKRCWHGKCKNISFIESLSGYRYCLKHFLKDRKNGYYSKFRRIIWQNLF